MTTLLATTAPPKRTPIYTSLEEHRAHFPSHSTGLLMARNAMAKTIGLVKDLTNAGILLSEVKYLRGGRRIVRSTSPKRLTLNAIQAIGWTLIDIDVSCDAFGTRMHEYEVSELPAIIGPIGF